MRLEPPELGGVRSKNARAPGGVPESDRSAIENILARWRPRNSILLENMVASEDTNEPTGRDGNDHRNSPGMNISTSIITALLHPLSPLLPQSSMVHYHGYQCRSLAYYEQRLKM